MKPSVIILTFNSESTLAETLRSVESISDDIHIVDSFSSDRTVEIARNVGANVVQHAFQNYGAQRNWAISSLPAKYEWQLHLDADERLTPQLRQEIIELSPQTGVTGFYLPRMMRFLGHPIRHGGFCPTWHLRLFRSAVGKCEARKYDQHFYVTAGNTRKLSGYMIDDIRMSLTEWTARHNRWADAEVEELNHGQTESRIAGKLSGNPVEKKRFLRDLYNASPLFVRPFILFFYRYILRLGFLDGSTGLVFYVLQAFWFRFLIDAKLLESRLEDKTFHVSSAAPSVAADSLQSK